MSAAIHWRPISKNNKRLDVPAPSLFMDNMHEAGMILPCTVGQERVAILKGMAIGFGVLNARPNPFQQILDLLEHHDEVELWAVY